MTKSRLLSLPIAGISAALLLTACGIGPAASPSPSPSATPSPTAPPSPTASPSSSPSPVPSPEATEALLRIEQTGGTLPVWETLRQYPFVVLYPDGRLITQGPMIMIYPGPALPNLQVTHLTQAGVGQVLQWAADAGLSGPDRTLGEPGLDAGVTVFTVATTEGTHRTSVGDMGAGDPAVGALREFQDVMTNVRTFLGQDVIGDDMPYAWDRLRIVSFPVDAETITDPEFVTRLDWPLESLATLGDSISEPEQYRCAVIEGEDLESIRPLLERSNELTLWQSDDAEYQLYLHPLLPDEEPCPA